MKFTAEQIAGMLSGKVDGDPNAEVERISGIEDGEPGSLTFLANPKYTPFLYTTRATIVIIQAGFIPEKQVQATLIRVNDPYSAFAQLLELYHQMRLDKKGVSPQASIHPSAELGRDVYVGEFVVIGEDARIGDGAKVYPHVYIGDGVVLGEQTVLYAGVKVYRDTRIGRNCIIHAGTVIGADGFGFAQQEDHRYKKVLQTGNVVIEDDVEIGANTCIDRATLGSTIIRRGVKLDNFIQIAHNVEIGEDTVIAAQTGISGSVKLGRRCMVAGQVGFVGHIEIADDVKIGAQSGISSGIREQGATVLGSPALDASLYKRILVLFRRLPDLLERIQRIENRLPKD